MTMDKTEIRKVVEINAPAEVIFKALTDPEELTQWFPDNGSFEPRVGGKMHFTFLAGRNQMDRDHHLDGEVLEIIPNKKLVYTFIPDVGYKPDGAHPQPTKVTWSLEAIGNNRTRVTLVHSGFTPEMEKHFGDTTAGWNYFVPRLIHHTEKRSTSS